MAKIDRFNGNLQAFASGAPGTERTIFGDVAQSNDLTAQITADFLRGWGIVGPSDQPTLQDFNGAMYTLGQLLAYLHQAGVPEYNASQEFFSGSVTQSGGEIFVSLQNSNIGNPPASSPLFWKNQSAEYGVIGSHVKIRMHLTADSASATLTANQIVVAEGITGRTHRIDSFNKVINLATTGAGGMDTGAAPSSGYVAIYAIYNPVTGVSALLAQNATAAIADYAYSGANMPAGFTASALVSVRATTGGGLLRAGFQVGREVSFVAINVLNSSAIVSNASLSISAAVPRNALHIKGSTSITNGSAVATSLELFSDSVGAGRQANTGVPDGGTGSGGNFSMALSAQQSLNYTSSGGGTPTFAVAISSYEIG